MMFIFKTFAESQKTSLDAAAGFTDGCLIAAERLMQLNLEVSRMAFEKSSEMVLLCLDGCYSAESLAFWPRGGA